MQAANKQAAQKKKAPPPPKEVEEESSEEESSEEEVILNCSLLWSLASVDIERKYNTVLGFSVADTPT